MDLRFGFVLDFEGCKRCWRGWAIFLWFVICQICWGYDCSLALILHLKKLLILLEEFF